jgi:hypothetical protein
VLFVNFVNKCNIQFKPPYIVTHTSENKIAAAGNDDEDDDVEMMMMILSS